MDKTTFLNTLESEHARWEALLGQIKAEWMTQPDVPGYMSIKDLIAHITWYEREMVNLIETRVLAGSELWNLPTDEQNLAIYEENRERPLADVLADAQQVYEQLVNAVETLSDEDLNDPTRFRDMFADWIPWKLIAENSYEHYEQHIPDLQAWLTEQTSKDTVD